ncbi:hypothetical protein JCM16496A_25880 [Bacteroides rodentium JCM 16496]
MNMEKEMMYVAPAVEVLEVEVEVGFDASQLTPEKPGEID